MTSMFIYSSSTTRILGKDPVFILKSYTLSSSHSKSTLFGAALMRGLVVLARGILSGGSSFEEPSGGGE